MVKKLCLLWAMLGAAGILSASHPGWDFRPGGNGRQWQVPAGADVRWTDDGLYIHGRIADGIEITFPGGLDADVYRYFHYSLRAAEYGSAYLYFARAGEEFSNDRRLRIINKGFGIDLTGRLDCSTNRAWKGKIVKLRFTPVCREMDNSLVSWLYFCDASGGLLSNGSFETPVLSGQKIPAGWEIEGNGTQTESAYAGKSALTLAAGSRASQRFELIKEYDIDFSLSYKLPEKTAAVLVHYDIYDREISRQDYWLNGENQWKTFRVKHTPPSGTAYVRVVLNGCPGNAQYDALEVKEIVPATEKYRWWNASHWIWDRGSMDSFGKPVYFRKKFTISDPSLIEKMFIQVSTRNLGGPVPCDNVKLYINGQQVRPVYDVPAGHMTTVYSVRPHLKQGSNLIAVEVVNLMSPGAVNLDILAVNKGNGKDKFQRFGSNESWRTFDKAAEGWTQLDFNDAAWRRAAIRGQATPGSFCRLPYRFMGTAGTVKLSGVAFPKEISTDRQYRLTAEVALNAEDGYPGVTGGAALFFQLINSSNNVVSKFHKFVITGEMLKKQRITLDIPFNPSFLRKDDYKLRIYADRLALSEAPAGFTLNREGNYLEMPVRVINERKVEISDARLVGHDGVARFVINGKEYPAFRFQHGAHTQFVTEESLDIADRVHSSATPVIDIQLGRSAWFYNADGTCNFDAYDTFIMSYLARHPNAYFLVHWALDTAGTRGSMREWLLANPSEWAKDHTLSSQSGTYQGSNVVGSMGSKRWQEAIADVTGQLVRHIAGSPYADRVIGLMPSCGISSEWLHWGSQARGFMDYSDPFQSSFREFLKNRYGTLEALNKAWKKDFTSWSQVGVPSKEERMVRTYRDFLNDADHKPVIDMREFLNMTVSDSILGVLSAVKKNSSGRMLAGVYYGYSMYVSGPYFGPFSGHHALGRLLDSPDLDFLFSPCRYDDRSPGGASGSMLPVASLRQHKKFYMNEADNRLVHSWNTSGKAYTLRESKAVIEREFAYSLMSGSGLAWLDFGEGWLPYDSRLCTVFENCLKLSKELSQENAVRQDYDNAIAVVLDEKAIYRTAYDQHLFLNLVGIYPHLYRSGAAVHWYLLDELEGLDRYKCVIFTPTVTSFTAEQREYIGKKLKRDDRTLVFLYSAGIYNDGKFDPSGSGLPIGMKLSKREKFAKRALRVVPGVKDPVLQGLPEYYTFGFAEPTDFYLYPEKTDDAVVLFRLAGSDLPGMIKKREGNSTVIYSSSPGLSSELIRNIAAASGIRIFNEYQGDVSYVAKGLCSVHSLTGGKRRFNVPSDTVKVVEMITGKEVPVTGGVFEYELPAQSTSIFRIYNK